MTEITDPKARAEASAAHTLMSSQAIRDAFDTMESAFSEKWKTGKTTEDREEVFHQYSGLRAVVAHLARKKRDWEMHLEATKEQ